MKEKIKNSCSWKTHNNLVSNGFEIEVEITTKISANKNLEIFETPITINSRRYSEGKKVKISDFFIAIYNIIKWRFILINQKF